MVAVVVGVVVAVVVAVGVVVVVAVGVAVAIKYERSFPMTFQRRVWHVDALFAVLMASIIGAAYYFDGPRDPSNATKPVTTHETKSPCVDGFAPENWICPDGERL